MEVEDILKKNQNYNGVDGKETEKFMTPFGESRREAQWPLVTSKDTTMVESWNIYAQCTQRECSTSSKGDEAV